MYQVLWKHCETWDICRGLPPDGNLITHLLRRCIWRSNSFWKSRNYSQWNSFSLLVPFWLGQNLHSWNRQTDTDGRVLRRGLVWKKYYLQHYLWWHSVHCIILPRFIAVFKKSHRKYFPTVKNVFVLLTDIENTNVTSIDPHTILDYLSNEIFSSKI